MINHSLLFITFLLLQINTPAQQGWYWQNPYPQPNELHDVCFPNTDNGWAVGNLGTMIYTLDGGNSWEQQFFGTEPLY
jgi:photosystem II stability/assembly factor-like uncharacterized protein